MKSGAFVDLGGLQYLNYFRETSLSSAITLDKNNANVHAKAEGLVIQAEDQNVRMVPVTGDGNAASSTVGFTLVKDNPPVVIWFEGNPDGFSFLEDASGGILHVASVKRP